MSQHPEPALAIDAVGFRRTISAAKARVADFARDESGNITMLSLIFFIMVMGIAGLVVDVGRLYNLHSQAQEYVDQVALASAAELDASPGAIDRALTAAVGNGDAGPLISETQNFAQGGPDLQVGKVIFLESLGTDPAAPAITPAAGDVVLCTYESGAVTCEAGITQADADLRARFVAVQTTSLTQNHILLPIVSVLGGDAGASFTTTPQATAGFERVVCNNVPMMICNPNEAFGGPGAEFNAVKGQGILAKMKGAGAAWGPGNFGLLNDFDDHGANDIRNAFGRVNPNTQCVRGTVSTKPGQSTGPVKDGINVRFDMYSGSMKKNDTQLVPAANVMKGLKTDNAGSKCDIQPWTNSSVPLPRDDCFMKPTPTCAAYNGDPRFGDVNWNRNAYWTVNHGAAAKPPGYSTMTRYEVYRSETANPFSAGGEQSAPKCQSPGISDANRDRRVFILAVVNCLQYDLHGSDPNVPVEAFAKVFLVEPVGNTPWSGRLVSGMQWPTIGQDDVFFEMIGRVSPGAPDGVLHEYPVLYR